MKNITNWSIRANLVALVLVAVFPALTLVLYTGVELKEHAMTQARGTSMSLAREMAARQDQVVEMARQLLMTVAKVPEIQNMEKEPSRSLLVALLKQNPAFATIAIFDADGMLAISPTPVTPFSVRDRRYYQEVIRTRDFALGEYAISRITMRPVLHFAYPILGVGGHLKGILVGAYDLSNFGTVFARAGLPEGSVMALTDQKGIRLYRYPDAEAHSGKADLPDMLERMRGQEPEGTFIATGVDGTSRLYGYSRLSMKENPNTYLMIRIGIPEDKALDLTRRINDRNIILALLCGGLAVSTTLILGYHVFVRSIRKLIQAAERIGQGVMAVRSGLPYTENEIGILARAIDQMASSIQAREQERLLAEDALRLSEEKYRSIFENAIEGIFQTTTDGEFLSVNPSMAAIFGYASPEEMITLVKDLSTQLYVNPSDHEDLKRRLFENDSVEGYEFRAYRKDGRVIWISMKASAQRGYDGSLAFIEGSCEDVTERKKSLEALRKAEGNYRGIFENAPDGIFQTSPVGFFISCNPAMARILGYASSDELINTVTDLNRQLYFDPGDRAMILDYVRREGFVEAFECRLRKKDGSIIWGSINARAVHSQTGNLLYLEGTLKDITSRKLSEEEIKRLNEELEDRVARRTAELKKANDELTQAMDNLRKAQAHLVQSEKLAALGSLVAGVAHEINTPVGVGVTAASHLDQKCREVQKAMSEGMLKRSALMAFIETGLESTSIILSNLWRASDLIRSFKRVAVDQTSEERRVFRLNEYIHEVLLSLKAQLKKTKHQIEVSCDPDLEINSYPGAFSQIITNLVMNSLIHAFDEGESGHIRIQVAVADDELVLSFSDDGKGIPKENLGHIFEPFFTTARSKGGTGLGLNILYNIVTSTLGGRMECQSEPGQGATFVMTMPLNGKNA